MAYISKAKILFEIMTNSYHSKLTIYYPEFITNINPKVISHFHKP